MINFNISKIFPKLIYLGISRNQFPCRYLAKFLLDWENFNSFKKPSDEIHIDGVDYHHEESYGMDNTKNETKKVSKDEINVDVNNTIVTSVKNNTKANNEIFKPNAELDYILTELRILRVLFLIIFIILRGLADI